MTIGKITGAAVSAAVVVGAAFGAASGAEAHQRYSDNGQYRVFNMAGGETLKMRSRRSRHAHVVGTIPFNARYISEIRGDRRGRWMHLRYKGESGWVRSYDLVPENFGPTYYKVSGAGRGGLGIHRRPDSYSPVRGSIPNHASDVVSAGRCEGSWCRVRYHGVHGWVQKHCLIVVRDAPDYVLRRYGDYNSTSYRGHRNYRGGYRPAVVRRWGWWGRRNRSHAY